MRDSQVVSKLEAFLLHEQNKCSCTISRADYSSVHVEENNDEWTIELWSSKFEVSSWCSDTSHPYSTAQKSAMAVRSLQVQIGVHAIRVSHTHKSATAFDRHKASLSRYIVSRASPLWRRKREGVWSNAYRACVSVPIRFMYDCHMTVEVCNYPMSCTNTCDHKILIPSMQIVLT